MTWISAIAIFFILWWVVLFATLPFGLRTQDEQGEVTLGTTSSASSRPHMGRALFRTTWVTAILFAVLLGVTELLGYGFDDLPSMIPDFG